MGVRRCTFAASVLLCAPTPGTEILTGRIPVGSQKRVPRGGTPRAGTSGETTSTSPGEEGEAVPRWKALPEELDPQIREFTSQLRRLVDRSELSVASVADATGYSKTSWERYLNGRLLAPKGAIVALAEVTETNPVHLTTMWELAERAWSRSEMRHDMTMEAIRIRSLARRRSSRTEFQALRRAVRWPLLISSDSTARRAVVNDGMAVARTAVGRTGAACIVEVPPRYGSGYGDGCT